jgi:hypothetical protein
MTASSCARMTEWIYKYSRNPKVSATNTRKCQYTVFVQPSSYEYANIETILNRFHRTEKNASDSKSFGEFVKIFFFYIFIIFIFNIKIVHHDISSELYNIEIERINGQRACFTSFFCNAGYFTCQILTSD